MRALPEPGGFGVDGLAQHLILVYDQRSLALQDGRALGELARLSHADLSALFGQVLIHLVVTHVNYFCPSVLDSVLLLNPLPLCSNFFIDVFFLILNVMRR